MQSFLLVACMVTFVTSASALLNFNCAMECRENSDCKTRVGPCNTCKAITGGDDMKCVPPSWETPKPCGTDCSSEDECQTEGRINPCPSCQPRRDGEGSACVQNLILKGKIF